MQKPQQHPEDAGQLVFRQVGFPIRAFDYLKAFQRAYEQDHGVSLSNSQALVIILGEHQMKNTEAVRYDSPKR